MARYDNQHEKLMALSLEHEEIESPDNQGVTGIWASSDTDEVEVVCLECGARFSAEDPDECEVCGGSDLDVA